MVRWTLEQDETMVTRYYIGENKRPPGGSAVGSAESSLCALETCM